MTTELQEHLCETDVVTINYAEGPPSGPPLVFLHGGSGRWQSYADHLPELAARFHLYAPDFRGQGKSGRVPGQYHLQAFTDDTIAFLRQCVVDPAYLFGHSLGGMVALMVAAQCPDHVRAVVVGDSPLDRRPDRKKYPDRARARNAAWQKLAGGRFSIDEIAEALRDAPTEIPGQDEPVTMREKYGEEHTVYKWIATNLYYTDPDMLVAVHQEHFTADYEMEKVLPAIRCPVLLLQADPDVGCVMTDDEVARALPLLAHPKYVRVEHTSHNVFFTDKLLQVVISFLETL
jgi:pimeloyl-ACP methyl ester carboxylesterase